MKRREFITLLGAAAAMPSAVRAQKGAPLIAVIGSGAAEAASSKMQMAQLDAGMGDAGLIEGRDYVFDIRWAGSDASRLPEVAAELLARHPRAVVVSTNTAAFAVQKLSRTTPIVGTGLNNPVAVGLVEPGPARRQHHRRLHHGGNVQVKLEMLHETLPGARRVLCQETRAISPIRSCSRF